MASATLSCSGLIPLVSRVHTARRTVRLTPQKVAIKNVRAAPVMSMKKEAVAVAAPIASLVAASPVFAQTQEVAQVAMETNILGLIATALFVIIPVSFLIVLFVKSESDGQRSGGFSQTYYDKSKKAGNKKTNLAAAMKGKGTGMFSDN
mmetsp:Transcript_27808/g.38441  ORF Transcript_27808/g.38441 Transcript_27808/m.38441 type:complete len:149 (+) Transcript_27808:137-583(+)|eukprot:CAMPEP_0196572688 /NCGR_PEP_ID=MMETSP1081-20130531/2677_1 /TAXON_ID=36882 /ORGANISM="Pyramimonas amylifera, Strain CCMP720" /LENGTH=148 /DNA_ID=CAMNT_0041890081 /DNA_START=137 /DNA_END=583 /DNA_ORIENTATION=-